MKTEAGTLQGVTQLLLAKNWITISRTDWKAFEKAQAKAFWSIFKFLAFKKVLQCFFFFFFFLATH